jgi:hypothetical protein
MTGKTAYAAMLKTVISPGLRRLGFTGSGGRYVWPSETHWAQIGFQKTMFGTEAVVSFTFNISIVSKTDWETMKARWSNTAERPAPTVGYGEPHDWRRIGQLIPPFNDLWWDVTATTDITDLGDNVVALVEEYALPAIRTAVD